jgi:hypothetical protein
LDIENFKTLSIKKKCKHWRVFALYISNMAVFAMELKKWLVTVYGKKIK